MSTTLKFPVTAKDHIQGNESAPITLIEYGDYECQACGFAYHVIKHVQHHFAKNIRFIFRNFPLAEIHPYATMAAETAEFADDYNCFWEMHDLIYENRLQLNRSKLIELVNSLQLPVAEFENALQIGKYKERIQQDFMSGVRSGVNGTPTFYINGFRHDGPFEYEDLISAIEQTIHV